MLHPCDATAAASPPRTWPVLRTLPVLYLVGFAAAAAPPTQRTRRQALRYGVGGAAAWPLATAALPSDNAGALTTLRRRVGQKTLAQGSYGLDAPDVYYPDFFEGTWRVTSKAIEVSAPCGAPLFGGLSLIHI